MLTRTVALALAILLQILLQALPAQGQSRTSMEDGTTPPPATPPIMSVEGSVPGVVVLALGSVTAEEQETGVLRRLLSVPPTPRDQIFELQMAIARRAAEFGPVLLLVADAETHAHVAGACSLYNLCRFMEQGRVRLSIVQHQGPWIRDYGPQFGTTPDGLPVVIDARYNNRGEELELQEQRVNVNRLRKEVLEMLASVLMASPASSSYSRRAGWDEDSEAEEEVEEEAAEIVDEEAGISEDTATTEETEEDEEALWDALLEELEAEQEPAPEPSSQDLVLRLTILRDLAEVYADHEIIQRRRDDVSPYQLADAVLVDPRFSLYRPPIALDGGNLLRFPEDECLTTRELIGRNNGIEKELSSALAKYYSCKKVIYLQPLPGPVIKHIDMFLLPVNGKKVLLASYAPQEEPLRSHWKLLSSEEKALIFEASLAMQKNELDLQRAGYQVIRVPALPPTKGRYGIYFPTMLNALVRSGENGRRQVLVPTYDQAPEAFRQAALERIREAFGPSTQIDEIESTVAAQGQGAVHCLTLTVPLDLSIFVDRHQVEARTKLAEQIRGLESEIYSARAYNLLGTWRLKEAGDGTGPTLVVNSSTMTFQIPDEAPLIVNYEVYNTASDQWFFSAKSTDDGEEREGKITWRDGDQIELTFAFESPLHWQREAEATALESSAAAGIPESPPSMP